MGNSNIIIAVVVGIIVLKLAAVHLYLKVKVKDSKNPKISKEDNGK